MFYRPKGGGLPVYIKTPEEIKRENARLKAGSDIWHREWITVWRLKRDRLWTDGMISKLLGKPKAKGKYKVFPLELVNQAEQSPEFQSWLAPRLIKAVDKNRYFEIKPLFTSKGKV